MQRAHLPGKRGLLARFRSAFRGVSHGIRREGNFVVHFLVAAAAVAAAGVMRSDLWEWAVLVVCIGTVLVAEMFNTALECMAKAITDKHDEQIRDALDIASAAVLVAAVSASVVGLLIFGHRLGLLLNWWPN